MYIQLALDRLTKEQCFDLVEVTSDYINWVEIGTGVIKEYGISIVRDMHAKHPGIPIVADMKTCDAGKYEARLAFEAGAKVITVMAFADDQTIHDMLEVANTYNARVMVDLLGVNSRERVMQLRALGVDLVCLHIGKDMQVEGSKELFNLFELVEGINNIEVAIAGGLNEDSITQLKGTVVNVFIVGSAITESLNPRESARRIAEKKLI